MKQLTSYNRVAGYLNKLFDLLNQRFFEGELSRPTLTIQSTPKAYAHFSVRDDISFHLTIVCLCKESRAYFILRLRLPFKMLA